MTMYRNQLENATCASREVIPELVQPLLSASQARCCYASWLASGRIRQWAIWYAFVIVDAGKIVIWLHFCRQI